MKIGVGICMDLNPYEFKAPFSKCEFGNFCLKSEVELIVFMANWILRDKPSEEKTMEIINYWISRLAPILKKSTKKVYLCTSNRIGKENETSFIGSSCILQLSTNLKLLTYMNSIDSGVIDKTLYWKTS